jgi:hypothetical protein
MSTDDTVTLSVPREPGYRSLLHLVLGGMASRGDMSVDALDDLQLAVDNLLAEDQSVGEDVVMSVSLGDHVVCITIGALTDTYLRHNLADRRLTAGMEDKRIDMCLLLDSLVDGYTVHERESGVYAVELRKQVR